MYRVTNGFTLVFVAVAWLVGIVLSSLLPLPLFALIAGILAALLFLVPLWRDAQGRLIMLLLVCLLLGACRYTLASPGNDAHSIRPLIGAKKVVLQGMVADEPKLTVRSRTLVITVSEVQQNGVWQAAHGQLSVVIPGTQVENPYSANYGDVVELQGSLQAPPPHSSPEVVASMSFPLITVYENQGNPLLAFFYHLRLLLASVIMQTLPQPEAALLTALAFSLRTPALDSLVTVFNAIGCAHLIAPSGYKVTVFVALIETLVRQVSRHGAKGKRLLPAQLRRRQWSSACIITISVVIYTLLSGAVPAALRAGIMGMLVVIATPLGRRYNVYTALVLVAMLLSLVDPFVLWDVGFQLSFVGTLGIVLLTPYFQRLLRPIERLPFGHTLVEIVAVTLAAQVATLPLIVVTFQITSFIAPIANIFTVPLFGTLILLGAVIAGTGLFAFQLALLLSWLAYPLLWYLITVVQFLYTLPLAYATVTLPDNLVSVVSWSYYALLVLGIYILQRKKPLSDVSPDGRASQSLSVSHISHVSHVSQNTAFRLSKKTWFLLQLGAALLILLATGTAVLASRPPNQLTIAFLNVGPAGKPPQGEAIFIRTPDGKTMLIDGGSDATSLGKELDNRLPSWQRSLDFVILTSPRAANLTGLQDVVTRYSIGEVLDAGMLHPSAGYALWRSTISQRHIRYVSVSKGTTIRVGTQLTLQVLWPDAPLHKGTDEVRDDSMVLRLVSPKLRMLLLGDVAESVYGLTNLLSTTTPNFLTSEIVQIVGEVGKTLPDALEQVLQQSHPTYLIVSPTSLSSKQRKLNTTTITLPSKWSSDMPHMDVMQTAQRGTIVITATSNGWNVGVA